MSVVTGPDNKQTLSTLIDQYQEELLKICVLHLRDAQLAEDAVQETFLKAYKSLHLFRGESSMRTWLTRIAINTCRSMQRRSWYRFEDRSVDVNTLSVALTGMSETSITLMEEIARLPHKEREAVWLYYYKDMKIKEVAQVLGVTNSAVTVRLTRAYARLRKALGGNEYAK